MQTSISQIGPADYQLDIVGPASDMAPRFDAALRRQRGRVQTRGFRPGKAPLDLVRRLYGREIAGTLAEELVQETYQTEVVDQYEVIGRPQLTRLDFDGSGDLSASIRFGVRPDVEVNELTGQTMTRLVHEITDAEIDEEIARLRSSSAAESDAPEGHAIGDADVAIVDLAPIADVPADGDDAPAPHDVAGETGVRVVMDDARVHTALRDALRSTTAGATFEVKLPHGDGDHAHAHRYAVTVTAVKARTLPELDDAFASAASQGRHETLAALRDDVRSDLDRSWTQRQREYGESQMIEALLAANPIPVPSSAVEIFLESFLRGVADENKGTLPEGFDVNGYAQRMAPEAERQARWMLVRDALVERHGLSVDDSDVDAYFARTAQGLDPSLLRRLYAGQEGVMDRLQQQILSEKLFDTIGQSVTYVDKDFEAVQAELVARREAELAAQAAARAEADAADAERKAELRKKGGPRKKAAAAANDEAPAGEAAPADAAPAADDDAA